MKKSKERKHDKAMARQNTKAHRKNHGLTSRITMNRYKRIAMGFTDTEFVIIDGIVYT